MTRTRFCASYLVLALAGLGIQAEQLAVRVRYRSAETVYLEAGSVAGLEANDRLMIMREGRVIAEIEVIFIAEHSASCRLVSEQEAVVAGDLAYLDRDSRAAPEREEVDSSSGPQSRDHEVEPLVGSDWISDAKRKSHRTRISGSLSIDWERFSDASTLGLDFQRINSRVSLRAHDIAGLPLGFRLRVRGQENRRERSYSNGAAQRESRDRLYEAAFLYEPTSGRFSLVGGRIGTSPFVGIGFLDGVIGQVRVIPALDVGAFYGSRPLIEEFGFESFGQKFGGYARLYALDTGARPAFEMFLAGTREEGDEDVSRDYVTLETRYTPSRRWSLYQRAELDLNTGWREEAAGTSSQLSNFSLAVTTRLTETSRLSVSYDRFERYWTEETRSVPDQLFDDFLRQGVRARFDFGRPGRLNVSLNAGWRARDDEKDDTTSFGFGLRHSELTPWRLQVGGDVLAYANPLADGVLVRTRTAKRFNSGHEVFLDLGGRVQDDALVVDESRRGDYWVRLGGWLELPWNLFAHAEIEHSDGDDLSGQRLLIGAGFRL